MIERAECCLERHGGHVAGNEHAGHRGLTARVDDDLAVARELQRALQPLGVEHQADLHEHTLEFHVLGLAAASIAVGQAVDLAISTGDLGGLRAYGW